MVYACSYNKLQRRRGVLQTCRGVNSVVGVDAELGRNDLYTTCGDKKWNRRLSAPAKVMTVPGEVAYY